MAQWDFLHGPEDTWLKRGLGWGPIWLRRATRRGIEACEEVEILAQVGGDSVLGPGGGASGAPGQ